VTTLNMDGYTDLPAGSIAAIVTHLEMTRPNEWRLDRPDGVDLTAIAEPEPDWYRALFLEIGEEWLWFSRLILDDGRLSALFRQPGRAIYVARDNGADAGLLELDFVDPANVEIAFFGLVPAAVGRSLGRWLMGEALAICWSRAETQRVWLHTCTLDHPNALPFYMKCGFTPFLRSVEVARDPRLTGVMRESAGRRHPVIAAIGQSAPNP